MGTTPARGWVVVAEDEPAIADLVRLYLERDGFGVRLVRDGRDALRAVRTDRPVALVLDIGLPGMDGIEVCRTLRAGEDWTPVLFVTARDDEVDRVLGLELGADDYVTKPFSPRELVARVRAVLRRASGPARTAVSLGAVVVDREARRVSVDGSEVDLTPTEFDLLAHLVGHPDRVFSREELLSTVWGYAAAAGTRTGDGHVAQLRAKLGAPIRTVRGVGYAGRAGDPSAGTDAT
jgi:DNA-binding response OmpR family regulator